MGLASKLKKSKSKKKTKTSDKISAGKTVTAKKGTEWQDMSKYIFGFLLVVYLLCYVLKLWGSLGDVQFWSDENVHAYISSIIAETHRLPAKLPDVNNGGFVWSYPPLFHIIAAAIMSVMGFAALKYINLILLILFFICFYFLIQKYYGQNTALIACLLISLSPAVATNSVRFMTDILSMILIFFSAFFFFIAVEKENIINAVLSGTATGLLLLSKQTGIIVLSFYGLLLVWFIWKDKKKAKIIFYILLVAVTVYLPYLIWGLYHKIDISGFLSLFLGKYPAWASEAVKTFREYDSGFKEFAKLFYTGAGPIITIFFLIPVYYLIKSRAKDLLYSLIFTLLIYLVLAMSIWHITNSRHTLSLLPILTFLVGYACMKAFPQKAVINAIILLLFIASAYSLYKMPNYREKYNLPKEFAAIAQKIKDSASDEKDRVFSINAFDVLMYGQKPVIWPYPNLGEIPLELFEKQRSQELYALLNKYNIKYILINMVFVRNTDTYWGRNYPLHFMRNCELLEKQGRLTLEAISESRKWILLKIL
jgi:4-amino-4-deoxy-L-arabinose transferase-like glycosyltransferase